ncbi:uracil permease [Clostridium fallax]|uniref:Uracil permease n=1 Tax=Clostridium fallax TaxID=1533 RepID=A0A1M4T5F1_9CLOT|nr:uracil permease [Clostridium fallax]SHE39679.1 uracil permease [Clostridium fallax]SQB22605.1 uracil transporter [Clostridium fallax]
MQLTAKTSREQSLNQTKDFISIEDKVPLGKAIPLSIQHLFAMFGASVLVPILLNIDPATVLFFNGIGTLLYAIITKRKIPAYLGSSFAFIAPTALLISNGYGFQYAQGGFVISGVVFSAVALLVGVLGIGWINKLFPPAAMGAIVTIIGLELAPTAADMAGLTASTIDPKAILVSMITLTAVILSSVLLRGFLKVIPVLIGVTIGYLTAWAVGMVNFSEFNSANFFVLPQFHIAKFDINSIMIILPATFVVIAEHIGHLAVTSNVVGRDLSKNPGLNKSLLGDGCSTIISGFFGSVPTTTYGENIGVMAITKVYSTYVICGAGVLSIILGFSGKLSALIRSIPNPVIGGVSILLFGTIATSGLRTFIDQKVDFSKSRNLILTSVILIIGLSGVKLSLPGTAFELKGMALASVVAIALNLVFIIFDKLGIMNGK